MKIKRKGKVHPSPAASSSSPLPPPRDGDRLSVLLPATILALTTVLSVEDRLVLSYMIKSPTTSDPRKKRSDKHGEASALASHKSPLFECNCFNCYTRYWYLWDSSPNRNLIHQVIEAFENHLTSRELSNNGGGARECRSREKTRRREARKSEIVAGEECSLLESVSEVPSVFSAEEEVVELMSSSPEREESEAVTVADRVAAECVDKGLARKMLPDVLGLLNSRLWNLWNPTV